ncbi:hypothetical protein FGL86_13925 [Pistricoccus aurantiacus]|uniref:Uncharacterized protein n=1 Tax=Pistricoccus aurantiacus TaxID=1883414 RepID=A0A5B8STR0_9GAMM|nr:hypothetical protein FGL86_13925 [Pistricoccus aurantiacus]
MAINVTDQLIHYNDGGIERLMTDIATSSLLVFTIAMHDVVSASYDIEHLIGDLDSDIKRLTKQGLYIRKIMEVDMVYQGNEVLVDIAFQGKFKRYAHTPKFLGIGNVDGQRRRLVNQMQSDSL